MRKSPTAKHIHGFVNTILGWNFLLFYRISFRVTRECIHENQQSRIASCCDGEWPDEINRHFSPWVSLSRRKSHFIILRMIRIPKPLTHNTCLDVLRNNSWHIKPDEVATSFCYSCSNTSMTSKKVIMTDFQCLVYSVENFVRIFE